MDWHVSRLIRPSLWTVSLHTGDFPLSRVDFASSLVSLLCLCEVSGERGRASPIHANLHLIRTTGARHLWQMSISSRSAGSVSTGAMTGLSVCVRVCKRERVYYGSGPVDFSLAPRGRLGHKLLSSPPASEIRNPLIQPRHCLVCPHTSVMLGQHRRWQTVHCSRGR